MGLQLLDTCWLDTWGLSALKVGPEVCQAAHEQLATFGAIVTAARQAVDPPAHLEGAKVLPGQLPGQQLPQDDAKAVDI